MARQPKLDIESYVNELAEMVLSEVQPTAVQTTAPLESVLKGRAVELSSDAAGTLLLVADEEDARRLGAPRGVVYTAAEARRVIQVGDPAGVREIHEWKRTFNTRIREFKGGASGKDPTP